MKTMKKLFVVVLSVAMLGTGLYLVPADADKVQAETTSATVATPPDGVLNVKAQTTKTLVNVTDETDENYLYNGQYIFRMISSIDSLNYNAVGFRVTYVDEEKGKVTLGNETDQVFERIESTTDVAEYSFGPKIVDTDAEYLFTAKLAVPADETARVYTVEAYCITKAGTTIYGPKRCVAIDDAAVSVLSFGVDTTSALSTEAGAYTATVTSQVNEDEAVVTKNGTVEVLSSEANYANVRVTLTDGTVADLASVSTVSIKQDSTEVASTTYRNYDTSYLSGTYAGKPDTSWYDLQPTGDTQYVVATNADLYGLSVVSQTDNFDGDTVHLIADIDANNGTAASTGWTKAAEGGTEYNWTPIGTIPGTTSGEPTLNKFAGIFDGNMHVIEGVKAVNTNETGIVGLFAATAMDSIVKELQVKNSYFSKTGTSNNDSRKYCLASSVVGHCGGDLNKIYSNSFVNSEKCFASGGLVAQTYSSSGIDFVDCCFAGEVNATQLAVGGVIGASKRGNTSLTNCINRGVIAAADGFVGGLIGRAQFYSGEWDLSGTGEGSSTACILTDCINVGQVTKAGGTTGTYSGAVIGHKTSAKYTFTNVYMQAGTYSKDFGSSDASTGLTISRETDELKDTSAYQWLSFDFENDWTVVEGDYPIQQCFAEEVKENEFMPRMGWYNSKLTEYTISTAEELYGFSELNNNHNSADNIFTGKTIYLGDDIEVNAGTVAEWEENEFSELRQWTPIGTTKAFRGNFNGNGKTISGLYMSGAGVKSLFGNVYNDASIIQNFNLINSYITSTDGGNGSVASNFRGKIQNVYSNATINVTTNAWGLSTGGIISDVNSYDTTISNCWYAGKITTKAGGAGGIVGNYNYAYTLTIENCLVSGDIVSTRLENTTERNTAMGGFVGRIQSNATKLDIKNCLFTGDIYANPNKNTNDLGPTYLGLFLGQTSAANCNITITNTYYPTTTSQDPLGYIDNSGTINGTAYANNALKQAAMVTLCKKWSTSSTVEELSLDAAAWKDSTNGPILSAFETIHTSVNAGN